MNITASFSDSRHTYFDITGTITKIITNEQHLGSTTGVLVLEDGVQLVVPRRIGYYEYLAEFKVGETITVHGAFEDGEKLYHGGEIDGHSTDF